MSMSLNPRKIEALKYVANGDYRRVGMYRKDLSPFVSELQNEGLVCNKYGPGDSVRKELTLRGKCVLSSLT